MLEIRDETWLVQRAERTTDGWFVEVQSLSERPLWVDRAQVAVRGARRLAFVEHLLAGLEAIPITATVARVHAGIWSGLAKRASRLARTISGSQRPPSLTASASPPATARTSRVSRDSA